MFFLIFYSFTSVVTAEGSNAPLIDSISRVPLPPKYQSAAQYDSVQNTLAEKDRDNWFARRLIRNFIQRTNRYSGRADMIFGSLLNEFIHSFPYLLFVALPVSAFFLKLLYVRNPNNLYAGHAIYLVYLYVFTFLMLMLYFGLDRLRDSFNLGWLGYIQFVVVAYLGIYTLIAMKRYYGERWGKTIVKFAVWNFLAFITMIVLFVIFLLLTLFRAK